MTPIIKTGALAFWDTFAGPVPCKVTAVRSDNPNDTRPASWQSVDIEVTASQGAYKAGEKHSGLWGLHVFPRSSLMKRQYSMFIGAYAVHADESTK